MLLLLLLLLLLLMLLLGKVHALRLLLLVLLLHGNRSDMLLCMLRHWLLPPMNALGNKGMSSLLGDVAVKPTRVAAILGWRVR